MKINFYWDVTPKWLTTFRRSIVPPSAGSVSLLRLLDPEGGTIITTVIVGHTIAFPGT
jgi:hypothetical protein